jgi:hypothetical protein
LHHSAVKFFPGLGKLEPISLPFVYGMHVKQMRPFLKAPGFASIAMREVLDE